MPPVMSSTPSITNQQQKARRITFHFEVIRKPNGKAIEALQYNYHPNVAFATMYSIKFNNIRKQEV
jgi:hypothetical protein